MLDETGAMSQEQNFQGKKHTTKSYCGVCGCFSQDTIFGRLSCINCCKIFCENVQKEKYKTFRCTNFNNCELVSGCKRCYFDCRLKYFSNYVTVRNSASMQAVDSPEWRYKKDLICKYDNVCSELKFTNFPYTSNGRFACTTLINDFTIVLRRLGAFSLKISEFGYLQNVQQCTLLQTSLSTLLVLQSELFIYETNQSLNLLPISHEKTNVVMGFLRGLFSNPDIQVGMDFLNKLWELDAHRYIFVILTVIVLLETEDCKFSVKLNTRYVKMLRQYIRLKYRDPGSSFLISFHTLQALHEFREGMKKLTMS